jgi:MFS transporter, ACDE family, multidrug resistance protein
MTTGNILHDRRLYMIFTITLMGVMGVASLTPAFPGVISYFKISPPQVGWLIAAFTLPGIVMTPVTGILADRLGRKTVLVPSLFLFGVAGFACFFARDYLTLIWLRFFQGIGASCLGVLNITLIGDFYEPGQRQTAMGYNASVLSLGTATYPLVGGLLAGAGWNFPFLLPLLAFPAGFWLFLKLEKHQVKDVQNLNEYFGRVWQRINRRQVWALFSVTFLIFIVLYGSLLTYVPLLLKQRLNASPGGIGLIMSLMSLVTATLASQSGKIGRKLRPVVQILFSLMAYFIAMLLYWQSYSWGFIIVPTIVFGIAHGMILPCVQTLLVSFAPVSERAAFMSANSVLTRSGQTLGPLFAGLFYMLFGFTGAFLSAAALILVMIGITFLLAIREKQTKSPISG